jgi:hypothetical protein
MSLWINDLRDLIRRLGADGGPSVKKVDTLLLSRSATWEPRKDGRERGRPQYVLGRTRNPWVHSAPGNRRVSAGHRGFTRPQPPGFRCCRRNLHRRAPRQREQRGPPVPSVGFQGLARKFEGYGTMRRSKRWSCPLRTGGRGRTSSETFTPAPVDSRRLDGRVRQDRRLALCVKRLRSNYRHMARFLRQCEQELTSAPGRYPRRSGWTRIPEAEARSTVNRRIGVQGVQALIKEIAR